MAARIYITILLSLMTCSVLFGIGASDRAFGAGTQRTGQFSCCQSSLRRVLFSGPIIAWFIAPRLRARYWKDHDRAADAKP